MSAISTFMAARRPIPLWLILLVALAVHGPLLLMHLPLTSYDTNFHIFMASHYADNWFNPWNTKAFAGFSQTTYPPLPQQWIAVFSHFLGLSNSYMLVQLIAVLILPIGVYRYAKLWVHERAASYAALASVFLGSLALLLYEAGQLGTTSAAPLYLIAIPYFYEWSRMGNKRALVKGLALAFAAAAAHHATLIFGSVLFAAPVVWLIFLDRDRNDPAQSKGRVLGRITGFALATLAGAFVILLPYWLALIKNPIEQVPIPHQSRINLLLNGIWGVHYWVIPYGAIILALPFILLRGSRQRRLTPLMIGFWVTMIFGLGGTTPIPRLLLGRAFYILTFERFTLWATLMALPFVGLLIVELVDRYRAKAAVPIWVAAVVTCAISASWNTYFQLISPPMDIKPVVNFLNSDGHNKFRYLTLGFGNQLSRVATYANAESVDGDYNSGRSLPELTHYAGAQLTNAKHFGQGGMQALKEILQHADRYGLKYVFVRDAFYEPLMVFGGFRKIDTFHNGLITVWSKPFVPEARPVPNDNIPPRWQGILWGLLPFGSSIVALVFMLLLPDKRQSGMTLEFPQPGDRRREPQPVVEPDATPAPVAGRRAQAQHMRMVMVSAFPPSRGDLNEYGFHLARELQQYPTIDLTILADRYRDRWRQELPGFNVDRCWSFNSLANPVRLLRRISQINPDVVWFNMGFSTFANKPVAAFFSVALPAVARLFGYHTHVTLHAFMDNVNLEDAGVKAKRLYKLGGWVATRLLLMSSGVTVLLPSYRRVLIEKYGADPERVFARSHGLLGEMPDRPDFAARGNPMQRVLAFGNWGTYKRLEMLIEAMDEVVRRVPNVRLVIGGSDHPATPGYLQSVAEKYRGRDYVEFTGYVPENALPAVYGSASVLVMPYSSSAGSSGVAHLACQFGVPIVSADIGDLREMAEWEQLAIDFYPGGDRRALVDALVSLLESPERQLHMAQQNFAAGQRVTMAQVVREYLNGFGPSRQAELSATVAAQSWH